MKQYLESSDAVFRELESSPQGLSAQEAAKRLEKNGHNRLAAPPKDGLVKRFFRSLADPMILMLLAAAVVSAVVTTVNNAGAAAGERESYGDLIIILGVVILNTVLSLVQESKAEAAIDALMEMTAATSRVLRGGEPVIVKSEELVTGDVVLLEAGDAVPADCRLFEAHNLKAEESALTGESVPVNKIESTLELGTLKDIPLGDRKNMLYSGSSVAYGRGCAVVTATGMDTEMGKIADALTRAKNEQTPLQKKMTQLSHTLTKLVLGICAVMFVVGLLRAGAFTVNAVLDTFMVAVALAVAAIPEGMPAVVTIVLSIGVTSMSRRKALIRKLPAVETLGCTQIICSDKTGTLTQNKMTVVDAAADDKVLLATAMSLCSDAELDEKNTAVGEPTECALVAYAYTLGKDKRSLKEQMPRVGEAPFDSLRKMMSTVHRTQEGLVQYTKGAPDQILARCTFCLENGKAVPMTEEKREALLAENTRMASSALRVLAAGERHWDAAPEEWIAEQMEQGLTFLGMVGMIDPVRPEVADAVRECRSAGITPVMITGDHKDTAVAIGKTLGIVTDASQALTGAQLEEMSDEELFRAVESHFVYARVQPEHKTRIVAAWQAHGCVVAMTGDGVNDAPSIKEADIGIGMGITGTAVTKSAADMVLADDNFATIVLAVEEGRKIYDNVRKVVRFQLTTNMAEVAAVFISSLMGMTVLQPVHLLWINMITDTTPGLALGMEPAEEGLMKRKPRRADENLFSGSTAADVLIQGAFMAALIIFSYLVGHKMETGVWELAASPAGTTMAFMTTNLVEMFRAFCARSSTRSIFTMKKQNWWLWGAFGCTAVLTFGVMFLPPLRALFGFAAISGTEFLVAFGLAFCIIPAVELVKLVRRLKEKRK